MIKDRKYLLKVSKRKIEGQKIKRFYQCKIQVNVESQRCKRNTEVAFALKAFIKPDKLESKYSWDHMHKG